MFVAILMFLFGAFQCRKFSDVEHAFRSIKVGIFIVDRNLKVQQNYTRSCVDILGHQFKAGLHLKEALTMDDRQFLNLRLSIEQVLEERMPERVSLALLPSRIRLGQKTLALEANVIRNMRNQITKLVLTLNDITKLVAAEEQKMIDNAIIGIFRQRGAFLRFLSDFRISMRRIRKAIAAGDQDKARQIIHTIKGNASVFNLDQLVTKIDQTESFSIIGQDHIESIETLLRNFMGDHMEPMGLSYNDLDDDHCQVDKSRVTQFRSRLQTIHSGEELRKEAWVFSEELLKKPIKELLNPMRELALKLSRKLAKNVEVVIEDHEIKMDPAACFLVSQNLPHLIRNSIDHGIESESARIKLGKSKVARVRIKVAETSDQYVFHIEDDGRGLDAEAICRAAVKKGKITKEQADKLSEHEKQALMFVDEVSTALQETEISGRGEGMAAVLSNLNQVGATLTFESEMGRGTVFEIRLPKPKIEFSKLE